MNVAAILATKGTRVATIRPTASVMQAVSRFRAEGIGALVVSDQERTLLGLITERDVVNALAEEGVEALARPVELLMHRRPVTCAPEDDVKMVMAAMTQRRLRHLPVLDAGRLAGIISIGDVVKNRLDDMALEASVLRDAYIAKA
jgi:CBS domain-containing protein